MEEGDETFDSGGFLPMARPTGAPTPKGLRQSDENMTEETMKAWAVGTPGPIDSRPLQPIDRLIPSPGPGQIRLHVQVCGVCRTDLHLVEGDLTPKHPLVIPGHEVVGIVDRAGTGSVRFGIGSRVGVPWLAHTCGTCRFCLSDRENLCTAPRFTGWDVDGGYAEYVVVDENYAYPIPDAFTDEQAAPLLCAGIIGYRALRRSQLPKGGRLGIYGFGGSAHLTAQIAMAEGARVHVMTRAVEARDLALELGVVECPRIHRPAAGAARRRHSLRAGGHLGGARPRGTRSWRHVGHRGHLPE